MNSPLTLTQPLRLAIAAAVGVVAWGAQNLLDEPGPTPREVLACGQLADSQRITAGDLFSVASTLPEGILATDEHRAQVVGWEFSASGCRDGLLTTDALRDPRVHAQPSEGHTAVVVRLAGVRPQQEVSLYLDDYRVLDTRVLSVGDEPLPTDREGRGVVSSANSEVSIEVPDPPGEGLSACLRLDRLTATPRNPSDQGTWMPDCRFLERPREGFQEFALRVRDARAQECYDLRAEHSEVVLVGGARVLRVELDYSKADQAPRVSTLR